ncbi:fimbrial protein [Lelliottia wanjuensis]|uniref:Fimbrial protein n=1 Tax=Lelliottia wanjuensis TaxID=3050585 RepID=A0AAP4D1P4_9ENTR|nr:MULTISPECIES: fimbrial protein [unclassified Lelliottia]MDK9363417.1 fimbrial protein [Lelliottia sp. V106_12]MDK9585511.1 fimbrial protein [Lelliottia sp. V86_10]MDK9617059.1 fimbrial protein [Lelliottia sp. V106_9]
MLINSISRFFSGVLFLCLCIPVSAQAVTILHNCFVPVDYHIAYDRDLTTNENLAGHDVDVPGHLVAESTVMEANCTCPSSMDETIAVKELTLAGSPLPPGSDDYGYLTDKFDIDVGGYDDAINSPDGSGLHPLSINQYPTPIASMSKFADNRIVPENTNSVCSESTRPEKSPPAKRQFRWNVMNATFHIKKPILGKEIIPPTLVVQNYACLYYDTGSCDAASAQLVSNIWLSGSLSAPLSCTINEGSTIEVDFGNIVSKQFKVKGVMPQGYTLKNVDISYHCDDNAVGNDNRIKLTLSADQGVEDSSNPLIAKMLNRDDVGVRVFTQDDKNVQLDGSYEFPVTMDEQGNGSVKIKAAPVSTASATPEPGKFEGNVTVKMDLR